MRQQTNIKRASDARPVPLGPRFDLDLVIVTAMINTLGLAVPLAMLQIFDRVIPNQSLATLDAVMVIILAVIGFDGLLKAMRSRIVLRASEWQERQVGLLALGRLFDADLKALHTSGRAKLAGQLHGVQQLRYLFTRQRSIVVIDLIFSGVYILAIYALAGPLVAVPLCLMIVVVAVALPLRFAQTHAMKRERASGQHGLAYLGQALRHVRAVKLWGAGPAVLRSYDATHQRQARASGALSRIADIGYGLTVTLGPAVTGMTSLFGGYLVMQNQIGLAELAACILLSGRATQPVFRAVFAPNEAKQAKQAKAAVHDFLRLPDVARRVPPPASPSQHKGLELVNVARDAQFHDLTLSAPRGALVVVDAEVGADPLALLEVIAGEQAPSAGKIQVHGNVPRLTFPKSNNGAVRFLARRPLLFFGTLRENLMQFTEDHAKEAEVVRRFGLTADLNAMPGGLEWTYQGAGTGGGSPGLFKKLNLASAIAAEPEILLLEAPLVDLDPKSAAAIAAEIIALRGEATVVVTSPGPFLQDAADVSVTLYEDAPAQVTYRPFGADMSDWQAETNGGDSIPVTQAKEAS